MFYLFIDGLITRILWNQSNWPLNLTLLPINSMQEWILIIINLESRLGLNPFGKAPILDFCSFKVRFYLENTKWYNPQLINYLPKEFKGTIGNLLPRLSTGVVRKNSKILLKWQPPPRNQLTISFNATVRDPFSTSSTVSHEPDGKILEIWHKKLNPQTQSLLKHPQPCLQQRW